MAEHSTLISTAAALYEAHDLDALPRALQRNSLDYYYLSIYPSLQAMRSLESGDLPPYPATITNAYVHIPFCSGVCDFCSYYLVAINPRRRAAITRYLEHVKREFDFHARHTALDIRYLYIGGGTPSLIPPAALDEFLGYLSGSGYLNPAAMGTLELHPEFFTDENGAVKFLDILMSHGISRVSVGYQASDDDILRDTKRRHAAGFMSAAMSFLREYGMIVNIDLMYGLPDQSMASWELSLRDAVAFAPDSISTYFLFVDRGTGMFKRVRDGRVTLPTHRQIQTQHLMAQIALESAGYHELPNDFWARNVGDASQFRPERLPSASATLPIGPGAYGYYNGAQLANVFDLAEYERRMTDGVSPLWRGYRLSADEAFHRDVMFSLKNDPHIDCALFRSAYNRTPLEQFAGIFEHLEKMGLVMVGDDRLALTPKGRLCVEEIACLFRYPALQNPADASSGMQLLQKHNFAPSYPTVAW